MYPMIIVISIIGSFAVKYCMFDVFTCIGFGVLGWIMRKHKYPVAPVVLGIVLGNLAESNFRRAVLMGGYKIFFARIPSLTILILALLAFSYPVIKSYIQNNNYLFLLFLFFMS